MKITGDRNSVKFDLENGCIVKADGEMIVGRKFIVYKNTMRFCDGLHKDIKLSNCEIENIISEVKEKTNGNTIHIIFE